MEIAQNGLSSLKSPQGESRCQQILSNTIYRMKIDLVE